MYKLVCIDLDGTLLNDEKQVSEANAKMINKIHKEKGVIFVIATGRNLNMVKEIIEQIGDAINQYIIAVNGAIIKDNINNEYIRKQYIEEKDVINIIDSYRKHHLRGMISTYDGEVTEKKAEVKIGTPTKLVEDLKKYCVENNIRTTAMVTLHGQEKDLKEMQRHIEADFKNLEDAGICDLVVNCPEGEYKAKYIDITRKNNSKANGINLLAEYLSIKKEEIVVLGDGTNDISMLEVAGYKVAMENGTEEVKAKADYITDDNNHDGVAKALKYIFYKGE